jgi:multidrug efflux pump subunit AcrB
MQDLVAEPLEKRMQELRDYDRVETFTRPGLALMMVTLKDTTPPKEVPEEFLPGAEEARRRSAQLTSACSAPSSMMSTRM